jgi:predicted ribosome quality control (RQC) complex YloA/Tae2 family protein
MTGYIKDVLQDEFDSLDEAIGELEDAIKANDRENELLYRKIKIMEAQKLEVGAALQAQTTP